MKMKDNHHARTPATACLVAMCLACGCITQSYAPFPVITVPDLCDARPAGTNALSLRDLYGPFDWDTKPVELEPRKSSWTVVDLYKMYNYYLIVHGAFTVLH
jgi:hypothetical protein